MSGTDHPPSTTSPTLVTRRVLTTAVAALVAVAVLVGLIATTTGRSEAAAAGSRQPTATAQDRAELRSFQGSPATLSRLATLAEAVAPPVTAPPTTTTAPPPPPAAPAPPPVASGYNDPNNPAAWDRLAQCESGGNWAANTGNGYYGGIQFSLSSWQAAGGSGQPDLASRVTQIAMGQNLWHQGGWSHWPACSLKLGYR
jgi:Transglycosylase-like domain